VQNKATNFKQDVSYETANLFVWLFFAPASLYLARLTHPHFWQQPVAILRWVALVGVVYMGVYAGIFLCTHVAPFWWGSEAKQTYGRAIMMIANQWLIRWLGQPLKILYQRLSQWAVAQDAQIQFCRHQRQHAWRVRYAPCSQTSQPFALFGQAPLRIP
jgi:hypothetical protein